MPDLVVQQEGATRPLWPEPGTETAGVNICDRGVWDHVCTLLKDALQARTVLPFNIFLVFDEKEVLKDRDRPTLEELIRRARLRGWGARLLPVLCNLPFLHLIDEAAIPDLTEWMHALLAGRVSDLIQISEMRETVPQTRWETLRDRATAIKKRLAVLDVDPVRRPWRCALSANRLELAERLGPALAITTPDDDTSSDLLIVLDTSDPDEQEGEIGKYLVSRGGRREFRVVTHMRPVKDRLIRYCAEKGLERPFSVGGDFELWYLLLRLNQHAAGDGLDSVQAVPLAKTPVMRMSFPSVLLTCAFGRGPTEVGQWLAAAEEVGELLHNAPRELRFRVELAINPERLHEVLGSMNDVAAWIHLGHGSGRSGLWVPNQGLVPPDRWSPCFRDHHLRLALFVTCDSHEIARHFAEQGANIAVGFEGEVQSIKARHLSVQILKAMMADGMRGDSIIAGFKDGESRFKSLQDLNAKPRAYYPRRG